ncbi:MAG TPA: peroxiredoxin-like family protein [Pirellulaceae bacterium]|nr:peroxiredoxin-like family protein [Pirellulaceae bacterium]HMO94069.1 peroxiredoxin-like family protein [Pirellulaceae bacterium]HMP70923.1 peroxiredoxin-like family protein [Pirellulaceae bacterium]
MKNVLHFVVAFVVSMTFGACGLAQDADEKTRTAAKAEIPKVASETKPIEVDAELPEVSLKDAEGQEVMLSTLCQDKPVVLVFFRGGWCPICTPHTSELIAAYPQIKELGADVVAISPDSPNSTKSNIDKNSIPFQVLSDADVEAAQAFGLAFVVDDDTVKKYKGYGIDLEKASEKTHHALPIPAVYIVNREGKVVFAHSDPDYRKRLKVDDILSELKKLQ